MIVAYIDIFFFLGDEDEDEIAAMAEHYRLMALIEEKQNDNDMDQNDQWFWNEQGSLL